MSKSPKSLIHYLELAQKFKEDNLTIPSKTETIQSIKHALNHCTKDQLYLVADMMDLPHKTSESRMKLNILDQTQQLIYGHVIAGWNTVARWGFVLALYYLWAKIVPENTYTKDASNIFIAIMSVLGGYLAIKFLVKFKKSWDMRRSIQLKMKELKLVKAKKSESNSNPSHKRSAKAKESESNSNPSHKRSAKSKEHRKSKSKK